MQLVHQFYLNFSKQYLQLLLGLYLLSTLSLFSLSIEWPIKGIAFILLCLYTGYLIWHSVLLRSKKAIIQLNWQPAQQHWQLISRQKVAIASLKKESIITRWVIILRFVVGEAESIPLAFQGATVLSAWLAAYRLIGNPRSSLVSMLRRPLKGKGYVCVIFRDALPVDDYRILRIITRLSQF